MIILNFAAVDCGTLPDPRNGWAHISPNTLLGAVVIYRCKLGFQLNGQERRYCEANGQWSGVAPTCNRKSSTCLCIGLILITIILLIQQLAVAILPLLILMGVLSVLVQVLEIQQLTLVMMDLFLKVLKQFIAKMMAHGLMMLLNAIVSLYHNYVNES